MLFIFLRYSFEFRTSDADLHQKESFHRVFLNEQSILLVAAKTIIIMIGMDHSLCTRTTTQWIYHHYPYYLSPGQGQRGTLNLIWTIRTIVVGFNSFQSSELQRMWTLGLQILSTTATTIVTITIITALFYCSCRISWSYLEE